jgi:hypothetical protein
MVLAQIALHIPEPVSAIETDYLHVPGLYQAQSKERVRWLVRFISRKTRLTTVRKGAKCFVTVGCHTLSQ